MRIAMVSEHASPLACLGGVDAGGQNVHVAALAAALAGRGHEVTVFTRRDSPTLPPRISTAEGYAVEHVPAGPPSDVPKDSLLPYMPAFGDSLRRRWAREPYDVVHAHFWMSGLAAVGAARPLGIPVVQTFHALGTVKRRHQGSRDTSPPGRVALERWLCDSVDAVVATCRDEVRELSQLGLDARRTTVVPCGVDVPATTPPPRRGDGPARLLALGRLVERKGVGDAIAALAELPAAELTVAGGPRRDALGADPEACRLRELAEAHGVADRVHFTGRVAHDDVPRVLRAADVVVAVPWYEPFGIVPLEAMANGRPVVGAAVGGLLDTVVPGVTGELVPPRRPDLLAAALRRLLDEPARRRAYGEAGHARAAATYRWEHVAAATETVYASVARRVHRARTEAIR